MESSVLHELFEKIKAHLNIRVDLLDKNKYLETFSLRDLLIFK
jgi:hypothetical protein